MDSALESAFSGFGDREFYPAKEAKGARLGYCLISNHAFVDGNKRIGIYVMLSFLEMNGIRIQCTDEEIVDIGLSLADGRMTYEELLSPQSPPQSLFPASLAAQSAHPDARSENRFSSFCHLFLSLPA